MNFKQKIEHLDKLRIVEVREIDDATQEVVFNDGAFFEFHNRTPKDCNIQHLSGNNEYVMAADKKRYDSGCFKQQTGAVIVLNNKIIGRGCNDGEIKTWCERESQNCATGEGYHHCRKICKQFYHAERDAIKKTLQANVDPSGGTLYLSGHWWACSLCWKWMIEVGITTMVLDEDCVKKFTKPKSLFT